MTRHGPSACYVANLPDGVKREEIERLFETYKGSKCKVEDVSFKRGGYCFVELGVEQHAEDSVRELDRMMFHGNVIAVQISHGGQGGVNRGASSRGVSERPRRTKFGIIVSNLPRDMGWNDLKILGRKFADVTFADANNSRKGDQWRGKGILTFNNRDDLKKAFDGLDGMKTGDRSLQCEYEFPEVLDDTWEGNPNNDFPDDYKDDDDRGMSRGLDRSRDLRDRSPLGRRRTPPRYRSRSPVRRGDRFDDRRRDDFGYGERSSARREERSRYDDYDSDYRRDVSRREEDYRRAERIRELERRIDDRKRDSYAEPRDRRGDSRDRYDRSLSPSHAAKGRSPLARSPKKEAGVAGPVIKQIVEIRKEDYDKLLQYKEKCKELMTENQVLTDKYKKVLEISSDRLKEEMRLKRARERKDSSPGRSLSPKREPLSRSMSRSLSRDRPLQDEYRNKNVERNFMLSPAQRDRSPDDYERRSLSRSPIRRRQRADLL